eukprot:COSAG04_NODE_4240_length_2212_cov_12.780880_3_plen_73_part_00
MADEAHYLKNASSARAKLILPVLEEASRTILLTGTPALNCPQVGRQRMILQSDVEQWPRASRSSQQPPAGSL